MRCHSCQSTTALTWCYCRYIKCGKVIWCLFINWFTSLLSKRFRDFTALSVQGVLLWLIISDIVHTGEWKFALLRMMFMLQLWKGTLWKNLHLLALFKVTFGQAEDLSEQAFVKLNLYFSAASVELAGACANEPQMLLKIFVFYFWLWDVAGMGVLGWQIRIARSLYFHFNQIFASGNISDVQQFLIRLWGKL